MTQAELQSAIYTDTFFLADGEPHNASPSDYAIVVSDETAPAPFTNGQTRWKYFLNVGWGYEFGINNRPFTAAENAAITSGITDGIVDKIANADTSPTENSTKMVTSGGVFAWFGARTLTIS